MKLIPLTQGQFAQVDDEDFENLIQWKWYAIKTQGNTYAVRCIYNKDSFQVRHIRMHREIMGVISERDMMIDHRDHNTLNNQKQNLRKCTNQQNQFNQQRKAGSSVYKGVRKRKEWNSYEVTIRVNKKKTHIGSFQDEKKAALAYNEAALKYFGEFACVNTI